MMCTDNALSDMLSVLARDDINSTLNHSGIFFGPFKKQIYTFVPPYMIIQYQLFTAA
jgi:hypothetical protein